MKSHPLERWQMLPEASREKLRGNFYKDVLETGIALVENKISLIPLVLGEASRCQRETYFSAEGE